MRNTILLILCTFIFGCVHHPKEQTLEKVVFDTRGGGDLEFTIVQSNDRFSVTVSRYKNQNINEIFYITAKDKKEYSLVGTLFSKKILLQNEVITPKGVTGTWSSVTVTDPKGVEGVIDNINTYGDLAIIFTFVRHSLQ